MAGEKNSGREDDVGLFSAINAVPPDVDSSGGTVLHLKRQLVTLSVSAFHSSGVTGSGQPPRRFQRLTISQNSIAVCSVSYSAECA